LGVQEWLKTQHGAHMEVLTPPNPTLPSRCHRHPTLTEPGDVTAAVPLCSGGGTAVRELLEIQSGIWD